LVQSACPVGIEQGQPKCPAQDISSRVRDFKQGHGFSDDISAGTQLRYHTLDHANMF